MAQVVLVVADLLPVAMVAVAVAVAVGHCRERKEGSEPNK